MLHDFKLVSTQISTNYSEINEAEEEVPEPPFTASQLPLIPIIGSLLAVLVLLIVLIDISCYKINEIGIKLHRNTSLAVLRCSFQVLLASYVKRQNVSKNLILKVKGDIKFYFFIVFGNIFISAPN